jgi:hypothetical protein
MTTKHTAKQAVAASFLLLLLAAVPAHAQGDPSSANWVMPGCRAAQAEIEAHTYKQGVCSGIVRALMYASPTACVPAEVTIGQARTVAIQYIEQRPSRWHQHFTTLTDEALTQAWPCRR